MDLIREDPESPTRMRQSVAHNLFDEDEDMMDEDEDVQQPPSLLDKGKDALRRLADAVSGGVAGPMHLLGGRASASLVQAPPTPDMTPVFAKIASRGGAQREWSPRPLEMDFEEETVEDARDVQIRALRDEVAQLKERLRAAQRAATDKDASLAELRGKLAEKEAALAGLVKGFLPMLPAVRSPSLGAGLTRWLTCLYSSRRLRSTSRVQASWLRMFEHALARAGRTPATIVLWTLHLGPEYFSSAVSSVSYRSAASILHSVQ